MQLSFVFVLFAFVVAFFANNPYLYALVFFLFGFAMDGFSISGMNLIFEIAPEDKRPIYTALQSNITSIGLFFPILGGIILKYLGYNVLYLFTIFMISIGLYLTKRIEG
jgi:MFS family permease